MLNIFLRNESFLDIMSLVHFASGLGIGILFFLIFKNKLKKNFYFIWGTLLLIIWELFELCLRFLRIYTPLFLEKLTFIPNGWASDESILNISSDLITGFVGLLIIYIILIKIWKK